ncbi:MAG: low molecular weight phosphotyrosine protein phosphatase [Clostridia bacterium]|nr:low molecular weight phosphotyrosine protein phosphatase [Clostridia bacterium]
MIKVLFVCLGNICRSPMAEFIFRDMVKREGLEDRIQCASAATSDEERGNPVYPPARRKLAQLGIDCGGKRARQMTRDDYRAYDRLIGMESRNVDRMRRICGGDPEGKISRLLDDAPLPRDIPDPWFTGDFDAACRDITEGCEILLKQLILSQT